MPIFEYACKDCGKQFETLVRTGTVPECPQCHSVQLEKQLSVFATNTSSTDAAPALQAACGGCPHANAPGGCAMH
jgi:putative FmdB family regulatory protein